MFAKLADPGFLADFRPLLSPEETERLTDEAIKAAFTTILTRIIARIPGNPGARTEEMAAHYGVVFAEA